MSLIHNECTKLTATLFNTMATAFIAAGLFAPAAAVAYGISDFRIGSANVAILIVGCGCGAAALHWIGRRILRRLQE